MVFACREQCGGEDSPNNRLLPMGEPGVGVGAGVGAGGFRIQYFSPDRVLGDTSDSPRPQSGQGQVE